MRPQPRSSAAGFAACNCSMYLPRLCPGFSGFQDVADHRHGIRSRFNHFRRALQRDSANGHDRFPCLLPNAAQQFQSHNRIGIHFAVGREDRAHGNIIRRTGRRLLKLFEVVRRNPNPPFRAHHFARLLHAEIFLSYVHAVGAGQPRNIRPVVHKKGAVRRSRRIRNGAQSPSRNSRAAACLLRY